MKILMASSEAVPFAKTGGLADAVSALSLALAARGHDVRIMLPRYYGIDTRDLRKLEGELGVPMGGGEEWCAVYSAVLPGSSKKNPVPVYFVDHEHFFGRDGIYGSSGETDFLDNPRRFTFFCRAVFQVCRKIRWTPDILHAHDWPAALAPVFLKFWERPLGPEGEFAKTASVLTVHNLGYQGIYGKENFFYTNLGWDVFYRAGFEDGNMMNFLKAGLYSADRLNTVSPTYARETQTQAQGFRLDGVLRYRSDHYTGILNGIDTKVWNPKTDRLIPQTYSVDNMAGKAAAKAALQKTFGLPVDADIPVFGMVTRLTGQKGVGELFGPAYGSAWSICRDMKVQLVLLGSGEAWCENEIKSLTSRLPNFRARIGYDEAGSHLIEAGSDFFLMPSRWEPCGLNQMYSLVYGALPVVRNTGGLADTVENYHQETGSGTGFLFDDLTPAAIYNTVGWAAWAWYNRRKHIEAMRARGMKRNFSWTESAKQYLAMYADACSMPNLVGQHNFVGPPNKVGL
ncbi:MAG: glycogen synthase [Spirochaetaceae bacterium]|jgi:starch synthase|nr:glycogen synthase [Spirochaetaceae bacterium]